MHTPNTMIALLPSHRDELRPLADMVFEQASKGHSIPSKMLDRFQTDKVLDHLEDEYIQTVVDTITEHITIAEGHPGIYAGAISLPERGDQTVIRASFAYYTQVLLHLDMMQLAQRIRRSDLPNTSTTPVVWFKTPLALWSPLMLGEILDEYINQRYVSDHIIQQMRDDGALIRSLYVGLEIDDLIKENKDLSKEWRHGTIQDTTI